MTKSRRARTRERKQERQKQRQRNRQYLIIGGVVVVALILVGLFVLSTLPADAPIPETIDRYAGIERGVTSEGFPVLGNSDAPVEVAEYSSFACSHCEEFHETSFSQILERVEQGDIRFVYVPLATGGVPNAEGANRGALCAGEQGKFWEMHDVLFHWHNVFGNTAFQGNRIPTGAEALGLNMSDFNSCFNSNRIGDILTLAQEEQVSGTPSFKVNDSDVGSSLNEIFTAVDSLLGSRTNVEPDTSPDDTVEETPEATESVDAVEATDEPEDDEATDVEETEEPESEATEESQE